MALEKGTKAPDFTTTDQNGESFSLSDYLGKKVVLYFYPKDDTPGCTAQACDLRDNMDKLKAEGYEVLGMSIQGEKSHKKFVDKYDLNFRIGVDESQEIVNLYGVWVEKSMYGKKYMGTARVTYLIDEEGIISDVIEKVKTKEHAAQILA